MMERTAPPLLSPAELAQRINDPSLIVIDATWTFPGGPQPQTDGSIPGAVFFDIDAIADTHSSLPHMLPNPDFFAIEVGNLGISHTHHIVIYDRIGLFSSPRAWWSFKYMGAKMVSVLDGGLAAWKAEGLPVEPGSAAKSGQNQKHFEVTPQSQRCIGYDQLIGVVNSSTAQIIDARPAKRFRGEISEPREGLASGHMPGAKNIPWTDFLDTTGKLMSQTRLKALFADRGVQPDQPLIATCGSGVTACHIALACAQLGYDHVSVYDGSWAEWGAKPDAPIDVERKHTP